MEQEKLEYLQKFITLIRQGLSEPQPNYIALQVVIDNFLDILSPDLQEAWRKEETLVKHYPKYISNEEYQNVFLKFLAAVEQKIPTTFQEKIDPTSIDKGALQILVEDREQYLQKIAESEKKWRGKWKEKFEKQIADVRRRVLSGAINEGIELPDEPQKEAEIVNFIYQGAQEFKSIDVLPEEQKASEKIKIETTVKRRAQEKLMLGLPPGSSDALVKVMLLLSTEALPDTDDLPKDLSSESLQKDIILRSQSSAVTELSLAEKNIYALGLLSEQQKDLLIFSVSNYQDQYNKLLEKYGIESLAEINSHPQLIREINSLKEKHRQKLQGLKISALSDTQLDLILKNPQSYLSQHQAKKLRRLIGEAAQAPSRGFWLDTLSSVQTNVGSFVTNIQRGGFGSFLSGVGDASSSVVNNLFPKIFSLSQKGAGALAGGAIAAKTAEATATTGFKAFWARNSTSIMIVIFLVLAIFLSASIALPNANFQDMVASTAMINNPPSPPVTEFELLPGDGNNDPIGNPGGPIFGSCGSVPATIDTSTFPSSSLTEVNSNCPVSSPPKGEVTQKPGDSYSHSSLNAYDIAGYGWGSTGNGKVNILATHKSVVVGYRDGIADDSGNGYGNFVCLASKDTDGKIFYTLYGHMQNGTIPDEIKNSYGCVADPTSCSKGDDIISSGSQLGKIDHTGNSSGTHLHYEFRKQGVGFGTFKLPNDCTK